MGHTITPPPILVRQALELFGTLKPPSRLHLGSVVCSGRPSRRFPTVLVALRRRFCFAKSNFGPKSALPRSADRFDCSTLDDQLTEGGRLEPRSAMLMTSVLEKSIFLFAAELPGYNVTKMANRPRKRNFRANVRYTWRSEVAVSWAVVRLNEDGSETYIGSEKYKETAMRWAAMMDKAALENAVSKRSIKKGRPEERPPESKLLAVGFSETVKLPEQQIAFPWLKLFSRRPA